MAKQLTRVSEVFLKIEFIFSEAENSVAIGWALHFITQKLFC